MERTDSALDVDQAWERFRRSVQNEPVPAVWTKSLAVEHLSEGQSKEAHQMDHPSGDKVETLRPTAFDREQTSHSSPVAGGTLHSIRARARRRSWRLASIAVAAVLIVAGGLATPLGQKASAEVMRTFYVQQITPISQNDIQSLQNALSNGITGDQKVDLKQYGRVQVQGSHSNVSQSMSLTQIEQRTGYSVPLLPGASQGAGQGQGAASNAATANGSSAGTPNQGISYYYIPPETITLQLHVGAINRLIQQLGGTTLFPSSADNVPIVLTLPSQVTEYSQIGNNGQYENLLMMREPSVSVPGQVDLNQVRQAVVSLPFMPSDIVSALSAENWDSTLYLPANSNSQMVTVNGHDVMVSTDSGGQRAMWVAGGYFYDLSGSSSQFPTQASILSAMKGISR